MHFSDLLSWAFNAAKDQAQRAAIAEIQKAANSLNGAVEKHAPDVSHMVQDSLSKAAAAAVAGLLTKRG